MSEFDIFEILRAGLEAKSGQTHATIPEKEQIKRLNIFSERKIDFNVGDRVARNEDGENRYKFPRKDQVGIVTSVFEKPMLDEHGMVVHGEIGIVIAKAGSEESTVISHPVDFRYFKRRPHAV